MSKPLQQKTIRPGSLSNYSYYYSGSKGNDSPPKESGSKPKASKALLLVFVIALAAFVGFQNAGGQPEEPSETLVVASTPKPKPASEACSQNSLEKLIVVSIDKRMFWACEGKNEAYSAPIISGDMRYPETETPKGAYKIFAKEADTVLKGADSKGSWNFPVAHWMPFLDNKYGTYGFHDANWKDQKSFGTIDPYTSDKASHGCIELSDTASTWLFAWATVGTPLEIKK